MKAFPKVSVVMVLWRGDDKFAPNAGMLFDNTIAVYLSTEAIFVLCERIIEKLAHSGQREG